MNPLTLVLVILLVLWALGAFVAPFGGSLIHVLLVAVLFVVIVKLSRGESIL